MGGILCRCDCGNETTVTAVRLTRGATKSCGCLKRIQALENAAVATRDPEIIKQALNERFKGTKIMEDLQQYAEEHGYQP